MCVGGEGEAGGRHRRGRGIRGRQRNNQALLHLLHGVFFESRARNSPLLQGTSPPSGNQTEIKRPGRDSTCSSLRLQPPLLPVSHPLVWPYFQMRVGCRQPVDLIHQGWLRLTETQQVACSQCAAAGQQRAAAARSGRAAGAEAAVPMHPAAAASLSSSAIYLAVCYNVMYCPSTPTPTKAVTMITVATQVAASTSGRRPRGKRALIWR